jgi:hypothetical protein
MNKILSFFVGLSLLALAIGLVIYLNFGRPVNNGVRAAEEVTTNALDKGFKLGERAMEAMANAFVVIFQTRVNIDSHATVCDATAIAELAVLQRNIRETVDYSNTRLLSTKHIVAEQTFIVKIGFDLAAKFSASYDSAGQLVTVTLPEPKVLSLETLNPAPRYFLQEPGWINDITTEDQQEILTELKAQARHSAEATLAIGDAKKMIETRFNDLFRAFNVKVIVVFSPEQAKNSALPSIFKNDQSIP